MQREDGKKRRRKKTTEEYEDYDILQQYAYMLRAYTCAIL